jgi:flagellar hook capping protein FlgD
VARILPTLLVLALLGCTAAAFAVTEGLKLEKSPITDTQVGKIVAPDSVTSFATAPISFVLRKPDRLTIEIVNGNGDVIRTVARSRQARPGSLQFTWNGRDDSGHVVPDGSYRPRVHLAREHRTIGLPNVIRMDATPPLIKFVSAAPPVFSPDGDFQLETVRIRYLTSEKAQAILYVDGDRRTTVNRLVRAGKLDWGGRAARTLKAGRHLLRLRAIDLAGNLSNPTRAVVVRVRYIELRPHILRVKSGARIRVRVLTDSKRYSWHFGALHRRGRGHVLVFQAGKPGRYVLRVAANGHVARALVTVTP